MVMPPRSLWELLANVKVRPGPLGMCRTAHPHLPVCSVPPTDGSGDSLSRVPSPCREGPTFLRPTSSRRRWWWRGGWGTWGSSVPSSTGCATAKTPTASDAAASADVSARLGTARCRTHERLLFGGRYHPRASLAAPAWSLAGIKGWVNQRGIRCELADGASPKSRLPHKHLRHFQECKVLR